MRHSQIDGLEERQTGLSPYVCGRCSTVILHSGSAYRLSLLLLQNLLICKSIAYIYSGAFTSYIFVLYIYHKGRGWRGKKDFSKVFRKKKREKYQNKRHHNYVLFKQKSQSVFWFHSEMKWFSFFPFFLPFFLLICCIVWSSSPPLLSFPIRHS